MPRDVDQEQRLADIAAATLRVAEAEGTHAVTIRSVAKQLGGSTTLVTNYIPSRSALILNALDHSMAGWRGELDEALANHEHPDRMSAVLAWSLSTSGDDVVVRSLLVETIANAPRDRELRESLERESRSFRGLLSDAAEQSGYPDPDAAGDMLFIMMRGIYFASLEDPEGWPVERVNAVVARVVAEVSRVA